MNLTDWKRIAEKDAGHPLQWTDSWNAWDGSTAYASDGSWDYCILMKHEVPAVKIRGTLTVPLEAEKESETCQGSVDCVGVQEPAKPAKETGYVPTVVDGDAASASRGHAPVVRAPATVRPVAVQVSFL